MEKKWLKECQDRWKYNQGSFKGNVGQWGSKVSLTNQPQDPSLDNGGISVNGTPTNATATGTTDTENPGTSL